MDSAVIVAIISACSGVIAAIITYWFTKKREREAEWRTQKLTYYMAFIESLSGIVEGDSTPEGQQAFARASNNMLLFAPQPVIQALETFRSEIRTTNPDRTIERHDRLLADLLIEIRRDVGIHLNDDPSNFSPKLWASGSQRGKRHEISS